MIGMLEGTLKEHEARKDGTSLILVMANGVGYELTISARHFRLLPALDTNVSLRVYTHMREGSLALFGFADRSERQLFEHLLSTHGIGPALAMIILGSMTPSELLAAVDAGDVKALTAVPGVGTKTAQRLVLELSQRLDTFTVAREEIGGPIGVASDIRSEATEALRALGYGTEEIRNALRDHYEAETVEQLLRAALSQLTPSA